MGRSFSFEEISAIVDRSFGLYEKSIKIYPDALAALVAIRSCGFRLALVSNASEYSKRIVRAMGIDSLFDAIVFSCDVGVMKPDAAIYVRACSIVNAAPEQCFFVGDGGDNELEGADALGMFTILINRGLEHTNSARAHARIEFENLSECASFMARTKRSVARD
jgi:putative hydrolase of the HAD superfamily